MFDNQWTRLANNWLHDFSSGLWGSCVLVLWLLHRRATGAPNEAAVVLGEASTLLWWLLLATLVVIAATGAVRLVYWRASTPPERMAAKRPALIGKHLAFLALYGAGTWWASTLLP